MAYVNLLAKIESEINLVVIAQQKLPLHDDELAAKKSKLYKLANDYIELEGRFKELAGLNSVY